MTKNYDLKCTFCGSKLYPMMEWQGRGYTSEQVCIGIECDNYSCGAEWDKTGALSVVSSLTPTQE